MMAISLWQPYASLWLTDRKIHETRHWPTKHRGLLYVHAAKRPIRHGELPDNLIAICEDEFGGHFWNDLPRGAVIGIVELINCTQIADDGCLNEAASIDDFACGNFMPGRYIWRRSLHTTPIGPWPYKGRQGFFRVDDLGEVANRELEITKSE